MRDRVVPRIFEPVTEPVACFVAARDEDHVCLYSAGSGSCWRWRKSRMPVCAGEGLDVLGSDTGGSGVGRMSGGGGDIGFRLGKEGLEGGLEAFLEGNLRFLGGGKSEEGEKDSGNNDAHGRKCWRKGGTKRREIGKVNGGVRLL